MSSLVAYGSSDESENESASEEDSVPVEVEPPLRKEPSRNNDVVPPGTEVKATESGLFSSLPLPKTNTSGFLVDTDEKLVTNRHKHLQKKQPVKITIPSLAEFKDEEDPEPVKKKLKPSAKGSGLFSLLPAPKNTSVKEAKRPLVPNVLTKKTPSEPQAVKVKPIVEKTKKADSNSKAALLINYADSEEESEGEGDFFSLKEDYNDKIVNEVERESDTYISADNASNTNDNSSSTDMTISASEEGESNDQPLTFNSKFNPSPWASSTSQSAQPPRGSWQNDDEPCTSQPDSKSSDDYISVRQDDLELDEEALQRLCGRRAKRQHQDMQLIDVSGDAIMPDPKEWLTKQLTQEQGKRIHSHSHRKNEGPTTQQRRKHQITYLAFQAKENELELKNQWSQNRMSRKQTQSKYGF